MHQQRSKATLRGLRIRAYLLLTSIASIIIAVGVVVTGLISKEHHITQYGAIIFGIGIICSLLFIILSYNWRCPLCVGAVWKKTSCRRNKNAIKSFGISYRLGVALSTLLRKPYRCPYCGEKFSTTKSRS